VSTPVTWAEVGEAADGGTLSFETNDVLARIDEHGDHFADTLTLEQRLPVGR
jgi:bifunctional non-homologous end joining protein LigD